MNAEERVGACESDAKLAFTHSARSPVRSTNDLD